MPIQLITNARAEAAARHLHTIANDPSFTVDIGVRQVTSLDGGTITVNGSGRVAFRTRPNLGDPNLKSGTRLLAALTDPLSEFVVVIHALGSNDIDFRGVSITESAGVTSPIINRNGRPFIQIDYDVDGCERGNAFEHGYWVAGKDGNPLGMPPDVVLFHELVHALRKILGTASPVGDDEELETAKLENVYRAETGKLPRSDTKPNHHLGGAACTRAVTTVQRTTTGGGCLPAIIATALTPLAVGAGTVQIVAQPAPAGGILPWLVAIASLLGAIHWSGRLFLARALRRAARPPTPPGGSAVQAAFGNHLPGPSEVDESRMAYTVTITNRTDLTPTPVVFEELVLTFTRIGQQGVEFRFADNVAPGKGVVFPLCLCDELVSYAWGFRFKIFDAAANDLIDVWDGWMVEDPLGSGNWRFEKIGPHDRDAAEIQLTGTPVACSDSYVVGGP